MSYISFLKRWGTQPIAVLAGGVVGLGAVLATPGTAADCPSLPTQPEINACNRRQAEEAEATMMATFHLLHDELMATDADLAAQLWSAQRAWLVFRDVNCAFSRDRFAGGSFASSAHSLCLQRMYQQRIEEIQDYMRGLERDGIF